MFNVDENIMYGNVGVCRIEGILGGDEIGMNTEKKYYKLYSYREKEIIYTPTDTNVFIRKIMTKEQIKELIRKIPSLKTIEIQSTPPSTSTASISRRIRRWNAVSSPCGWKSPAWPIPLL